MFLKSIVKSALIWNKDEIIWTAKEGYWGWKDLIRIKEKEKVGKEDLGGGSSKSKNITKTLSKLHTL